MMSFHNIAALINAGFSEEQINKIDTVFSAAQSPTASGDEKPKPSPAPAPDPDPKKPDDADPSADQQAKPETQPDQQPEQQPEQQKQEESETQKMLHEMLGLMQKGFVNNLQMQTTQAETPEQILAKVINP